MSANQLASVHITEEIINQFSSSYVQMSNGCWAWNKLLYPKGYGRLNIGKGSHIRAHRFSWILHKGAIPNGLLICHKCDQRNCVNPDHLFLGTAKDNYLDAKAKARHSHGEKSGASKLNNDEVIAIRALIVCKIPVREIARLFCVDPATIRRVRDEKTWAHVRALKLPEE